MGISIIGMRFASLVVVVAVAGVLVEGFAVRVAALVTDSVGDSSPIISFQGTSLFLGSLKLLRVENELLQLWKEVDDLANESFIRI